MRKYTDKELKEMADQKIIAELIAENAGVVEFVFYKKSKAMFDYVAKSIFSYQVPKNELISELYLFLREDNWRKVREFEGRSKFSTWLSVVSIRFFLKRKAKLIDSGSKYALCSDKVMNLSGKSPYEEMIRKIDLINAIQRLQSPRDKYVILSLEIEGYEADEVALNLGVTKANLYNIKKRALEKLSKSLNEYNYANR